MKPVWGLINGHDRGRFEISLFADDTDAAGLEWFQPGPHDHVHVTTELDNQQLVRLIRAQLAEFSAPSERAYPELAVQWATDAEAPRKLAELRPMMRSNLLSSPVCRIGGLAADMERFYLKVLRQS